MDKIELDATIIGGGIIGLMTAYELKKKFPHWEIALIEAAPFLGDHSTGRNSGVLHAGLYYPTNSNKHLLCLEGIQLWKNSLCPSLGIEFHQCGKVIFAKDEDEFLGIENLWKKAHENEVTNLAWLSSTQLKSINTFVEAKKAFLSPNTGILDVSGALSKLSHAFESLGGMIAKSCKLNHIEKINKFHIETDMFEISSEVIINAAGFHGPFIREILGLKGLKSYLVRGNYISSTQQLSYPHLFYPVPPSDLKSLGVHSTIDLSGKIKFGPNVEDITSIDYTDLKLALPSMMPEIINTFKNIDPEKLYWDYAGIRSKLMNTETDQLESDFWIKSPIPGYIECLGIESPGLTSAPAIAHKIIKDFFE